MCVGRLAGLVGTSAKGPLPLDTGGRQGHQLSYPTLPGACQEFSAQYPTILYYPSFQPSEDFQNEFTQ